MSDTVLELRSIHKSYLGVKALDGVSLVIRSGEVLGLVGENGAGKSTLMKILGGVIPPTSGSIVAGGETFDHLTVNGAARLGIAFVHQELNLFENLDVAANVFIGREPRKGGFLNLVDEAQMHRRVGEILARLDVDFQPDDLVESLSIAQRQMVEIAKALSQEARVIIMDEPTSSLTLTETARLLGVIADLRASGVAIIYISHRLGEIEQAADRVVVLRDGRMVGELDRGHITHGAMIRLMIGRDLKSIYLKPAAAPQANGLEVRGLVTKTYPDRTVDLDVRRGEIVGLAGLIGAGRTELVEAIFGVTPPLAGHVSLDGKPVLIRSVSDAIANGIYLAPEDRKRCGLIVEQSVARNMTLAGLERYSRFFLVDGAAERRLAEAQRKSLGIKTASVSAPTMTLSGGNQQKIVLGKWLSMTPAVMIFDEPTRGIDVGAKSEIYRIMRDLADAGVAILMVSSDMEEVIGVSDRIVVMHEGRIGGHLPRHAFSEDNVLTLATGQTPPAVHTEATAPTGATESAHL